MTAVMPGRVVLFCSVYLSHLPLACLFFLILFLSFLKWIALLPLFAFYLSLQLKISSQAKLWRQQNSPNVLFSFFSFLPFLPWIAPVFLPFLEILSCFRLISQLRIRDENFVQPRTGDWKHEQRYRSKYRERVFMSPHWKVKYPNVHAFWLVTLAIAAGWKLKRNRRIWSLC